MDQKKEKNITNETSTLPMPYKKYVHPIIILLKILIISDERHKKSKEREASKTLEVN